MFYLYTYSVTNNSIIISNNIFKPFDNDTASRTHLFALQHRPLYSFLDDKMTKLGDDEITNV